MSKFFLHSTDVEIPSSFSDRYFIPKRLLYDGRVTPAAYNWETSTALHHLESFNFIRTIFLHPIPWKPLLAKKKGIKSIKKHSVTYAAFLMATFSAYPSCL